MRREGGEGGRRGRGGEGREGEGRGGEGRGGGMTVIHIPSLLPSLPSPPWLRRCTRSSLLLLSGSCHHPYQMCNVDHRLSPSSESSLYDR